MDLEMLQGVVIKARKIDGDLNPDVDYDWYYGRAITLPTVGIRFIIVDPITSHSSLSTNVVTEVRDSTFVTMSGSTYEWEVYKIIDEEFNITKYNYDQKEFIEL